MRKEAGSFDKLKMTGYGELDGPFMVRSIGSLHVTSYILFLASSLLLLCFFTSVSPAQSSLSAFLSKEVSLTDWGLTDPSQIGFVSIGILHKKEGKELFIYDIRRHRPVVKEPKEPRGRAPSFEGDLFLLSHYDQGNTNRLGGYFSGFAKSPSQAALAIGKTPDSTPALVFSYRLITPGFAGFWIHLFNFKKHPAVRIFLDTTPFTYLTFSIRGERGGEELLLQVGDRLWEKKEDSRAVGDVASFLPAGRIDSKWQQAWILLPKLPTGLDRKELASLVFIVKRSGRGRVFIKDIAFTKKRGVQIPKPKEANPLMRRLKKALWLWETEKIVTNPEEQQKLITFCKTQSITDLFLQIPYEAKKEKGKWKILWDSSKVRPLISGLHWAGVKVHALDGDPRFALKKWHGRVIAMIQSIIQYNREVTPQERFDGIRYDNEPYLLPNFAGVQKEAVLKQYLSLLKASQSLAKQANLTFGVDIPFWFDDRNKFFEPIAEVEGRPLSELIIDIVDNIGIMDYRTQAYGADGTITHVYSELQYAAKQEKKVFVGLETFELPDETILEFGPRGSGSQILLNRLDGKRIRLYWIPAGDWDRFKRDSQFSQGVVVLSQTHATPVPATKLTFANKDLKDLETVMQQTKSELLKFSSFYGFAIHSYESYRPWLERQMRGDKYLTFASSQLSEVEGLIRQPGLLKEIILNKTRTFLEVEILCDQYFSHRKIEFSDPNRIVVDFFNIEDNQASSYTEVKDFGIRAIRTGMFKPDIARVVFDLEKKIPHYRIERIHGGLKVSFWLEEGDSKKREEEKRVQTEKTQREDRKEKEREEKNTQEKIDLDDLFKKARTIAFQGNLKEAQKICRNILEEKPGYHDVRVFLGRSCAWDKEYDSARKELQKVLKDKTNHIDALSALIDVEYWTDNLNLGLIYCNQGLRAYPNNENYLLRKARILVSMEDFKAASVSIKQLLETNPSHKEALQLMETIKFSTQLYEVSLRYRFDKFDRGGSDFGPWHLLSFGLSRKFELGSIIGRVNYASRSFGSGTASGSQFEVDAYPEITKGMYAYLNAGYSSSSFFPKYRFGSELYLGLPLSFEMSLGVRYLDFSGTKVLIYTGNLGKYYKNYWFSFRPFVTSKSSDIFFSGIFLMRRYFADEDNYLTLLFGFGSTPVELFFLEDIERLNSYKIGLEVQRTITRSLLIRCHIRFEREEFRIDKFGNRYTFEMSLQQLIFKKY